MFKIGDKVRFITNQPDYEACYEEGILTIIYDYGNGDYELLYPNGLEQTVSSDDFRPVGPVREVTRREIVPGTYGRVDVGDMYGNGIWVEINECKKGVLILTAEELDNVAMIASQLAEALRDV